MADAIYIDRTFLIGDYRVRVQLRGAEERGESEATWIASTFIPYREGEGAPTHYTTGASHHALGAVLALNTAVTDKANVILHLTPHGEDGSITPVYSHLHEFARMLHDFAWGDVVGWSGHVPVHGGKPTFEEVTGEVAA